MTQYSLLPHQIADAAFLAARKFAGNFSGMGSGKTLTALEAMRLVAVADGTKFDSRPHLIIAPPIAIRMWIQVAAEYLNVDAQHLKTGKTKIDPAAVVYVMSYELATRRRDELVALAPRVLICDESHALKNVKAKRTKAILGRGGITAAADFSWMLTGTPQTRWNDDLFPVLVRADSKALQARIGKLSMEHYQLRYTVRQTRQFPGARFPVQLVVGNRNTEELRDMMFDGGLAVRRELKDVWAQMPPLTSNRLYIRLDGSAELTQALRETESMSMAAISSGLRDPDSSLSSLRRQLGVAKVRESVKELVTRIEDGNGPILVGAWHRDVIDALNYELRRAGVQVAVIDGRTSASARDRYTAAWNAGELDILIGQISAMGVSLNLQAGGHHIVVVEEDWSPSVMDQFYARLHRIGQAHHVHIDTFISDTKLDEAVGRISATKRVEHEAVMASGK